MLAIRHRQTSTPVLAVCAALLAVWLVWSPHSPDLAAQVYRVQLYVRDGFQLWDNNWYGGHYLPDYSLTFPPLAALLGLRWAGALAVAASTLIFARLAREHFGARATRASVLFAIGAAGDLYIGRLTFALGVTFALAAVFAATRRKWWLVVPLSLGCAASSPVAAAFLALVALADLCAQRDLRRAALLGLPALILTLALSVLFPEGGSEGFSFLSLAACAGLTVVVAWLLPVSERALRWGALLYLGALALAYVVPSPMGSNAVRLGVLLAPPLLAGAVGLEDVRGRLAQLAARGRDVIAGDLRLPRGAPVAVLALAAAALVAWQINGPIAESLQGADDPASHAAYYAPVIGFLSAHEAGGPLRVEVPFTHSHWETVYLGRRFELARGWERQLDTEYDAIFYRPRLSAAALQAWLLGEGVRYVALPDAQPDDSSRQEVALIRGGLPYLRPVFASAHWRVFAVDGAQPLASGPGRLTALADDGFTLAASSAGTFTVRVHYTPYWSLSSGASGCITPTAAGWTQVTVKAPGVVQVAARFSLAGVLGLRAAGCGQA